MPAPARTLPPQPSLEHLRTQARDLQRAHRAGDEDALERVQDYLHRLAGASVDEVAAHRLSRTDAQLVIAREYGLASWPRLVATVSGPTEEGLRLKAAIEAGDGEAIRRVLDQHPDLRDQPFPWRDRKGRRRWITPVRYAHARDRQASVDALLAAGADLGFLRTALWNSIYNRDVPMVRRLLARGVDPGAGLTLACGEIGPLRHEIVNLLLEAGTVADDDARMDLHRGDLAGLRRRLAREPALIGGHFEDRAHQTITTGTLLHIAAAHDDEEAVAVLLDAGADIDAVGPVHRETPNRWGEAFFDGSGDCTPVFHTIGRAHAAFEVLVTRGASLHVTARCALPDQGADGVPARRIEVLTPLGYALAIQRHGALGHHTDEVDPAPQIERLRQLGAPA